MFENLFGQTSEKFIGVVSAEIRFKYFNLCKVLFCEYTNFFGLF